MVAGAERGVGVTGPGGFGEAGAAATRVTTSGGPPPAASPTSAPPAAPDALLGASAAGQAEAAAGTESKESRRCNGKSGMTTGESPLRASCPRSRRHGRGQGPGQPARRGTWSRDRSRHASPQRSRGPASSQLFMLLARLFFTYLAYPWALFMLSLKLKYQPGISSFLRSPVRHCLYEDAIGGDGK